MKYDKCQLLKGVPDLFTFITGIEQQDKIPKLCHDKRVMWRMLERRLAPPEFSIRVGHVVIDKRGHMMGDAVVFQIVPAHTGYTNEQARLDHVLHLSGATVPLPTSIYIDANTEYIIIDGMSESKSKLDLGEGGLHPIAKWFSDGQLGQYLDTESRQANLDELGVKAARGLGLVPPVIVKTKMRMMNRKIQNWKMRKMSRRKMRRMIQVTFPLSGMCQTSQR